MNCKTIERQESDDAANLRDTVESPGFALIAARFAKQREDYLDQLVVASTWEGARFIQGQIDAIDRVTATPKLMRSELTKRNQR